MKRKITAIILMVSLVLALALPMASVGAHTEASPQTVVLVADGGSDATHVDVGTVSVWNDGTDLYVKYETTDGWVMTGTHLEVATNLGNIPQTKKNNPKVGKFTYKMEHDPAATSYTYAIPLDGWMLLGIPLAIAAHADVIHVLGEGFENPFWATGYTSPDQKDGWNTAGNSGAVATNRSNPDEVLGEPDGVFYSLGEGGSIIVDFGYPIFNGDGDYDISVHEISGNRGDPTENADVYVIVDNVEYYAGSVSSSDQGNGIGTVSIPEEFAYVDAVKIVDTTDKAWHLSLGFKGDGYDLDAVDACFLYDGEETAWGDGERFTKKGNWAMYFSYTVLPEGLVLWLDASAITLSDGPSVATWEDQSGEDNDATQTDAAKQPMYVASVSELNNQPVVRFDGDYMGIGKSLQDLGIEREAAIFAVVSSTLSTDVTVHDFLSDWAGEAGGATLRIRPDGSLEAYIYPNNHRATSGSEVSANEFFVFTSHWFDDSHVIYLNGDAVASTSLTDNVGETTTLKIGVRGDVSSITFLHGDIAEILIFNRALSDTEREAVEDYLMAKYDLGD